MAIAVGVVGLAVTIPAASTGSPSAAEIAVFRWFNDPPRVLGALTALINPLLRPVGLAVFILVVVALLFVSRRDVFWALITHAAGAGILAYLIANAVKGVVDRGRPPDYLSEVLVHGYPTNPRGSGYPSSHTAVAIAVVLGAWPWLNLPWKVGSVATATAIALNRMYVGAHLPLDVVGGVAVGLVSGGLVHIVDRRRSTRGTTR